MLPLTDIRGPCPPAKAWDDLAVGLVRGKEAAALIEHASWCGECAPLLGESIEVFAVSEEDGMAPRPIAPEITSNKPAWWKTRQAISSIAAALVVAAVLGLWFRQKAEDTDPLREIARLYSEDRTVRERIPHAAYAKFGTNRGADRFKQMSRRIIEALQRNPNDAKWLYAQGRLDILTGRFDEAIKSLEAAERNGDSSPQLKIDLATAYSLAGKKDKALDLLNKVLQTNPNEPSALFNRALIEDDRQAAEDLKKLLLVEPSGPWSDETREVLEEKLGAKK